MFIVDCDVHNNWNSADVLLPYLSGWWRDFYLRGERTGPAGSFPHGHRAWFHPEDFKRQDVRPQNEAENYTLMKEKHLDANDIGAAILTGDEPLEASTLGNPHLAMALIAAYNDWQIAEWLPRDERLYGSILIAPQDPALAAKEIRRLGKHPRMVQVMSSHGSTMPYGDPFYHPIFEACRDMDLPFAIHLGGNGGINTATFANGSPRYFCEAHTLMYQPAQTHLVSMIMNGVFEKFPGLLFVVVECGVSWVSPLLWRWDANFKALRKETPWVKKLPSEYFREHVRFSSQPLECPPQKEHLRAVLEAMYAEETLMFASDYPHWDQDETHALKLPKEWRENVMGKNALKTYPRIAAPQSSDSPPPPMRDAMAMAEGRA